jgi:hypothetical protein
LGDGLNLLTRDCNALIPLLPLRLQFSLALAGLRMQLGWQDIWMPTDTTLSGAWQQTTIALDWSDF